MKRAPSDKSLKSPSEEDEPVAEGSPRSNAATHAGSKSRTVSFSHSAASSNSNSSFRASSTLDQASPSDSDIAEVGVVSKLSIRKKRDHHKGHKASTKANGKRNRTADVSEGGENVPIRIRDTRSRLERVIDDIIDDLPALEELATFEVGSIPDYIDKIGVTREEAFARFPEEKPDLPRVPGRTNLSIPEEDDTGCTGWCVGASE
jgi:hypothetical protein